ncbi:uncharacterized protein [Watersipora subatra]|uniref:uncharacterized protein n=1 Tax=Watersipora subatra TaxID=2589382 RepID=UPI00355C95BB
MQRMKQLARSAVYWPRIEADIMEACKQCTSCAEHQNQPAKPPSHPWRLPEKPWSRIHIDHAINFLGSNWLVVVDAYSKDPCIHPTTSTSTKTTTELREQNFAHFGYPHTIVSDNATTFKSEEFQRCSRDHGIVHLTGAPYHSATNGAGRPCYAPYCGPRRDKKPQWVPAIVTKVFGGRSVNVKEIPRGQTWRRHIEQLLPRYGVEKDSEPAEGEKQQDGTENGTMEFKSQPKGDGNIEDLEKGAAGKKLDDVIKRFQDYRNPRSDVEEGIHARLRLQGVLDFPGPVYDHGLRDFLSKVYQYAKFSSKFANITEPLKALLKEP